MSLILGETNTNRLHSKISKYKVDLTSFFPTFQEAMQSSLGLKVQRDPKLVKFTLITSSKGHELFTIRSLGIEGGHVINIS
jgi:hypothetical protein